MRIKFLLNLILVGLFSFIISSCEKRELFSTSEIQNGSKFTNNSNETRTNLNNLKSISLTDGSASVNLIAGQNILAGSIDVEINQNELLVTYNTTNGFYLEEVHLWIGDDLSEMPQTGNGNPRVGLFPYKEEALNGATYYQFVLPLSEFGGEAEICNNTLHFAAHAALAKMSEDGSYQYETAWGEGMRLVEKGNWATYFSVHFDCDYNPKTHCETAFAFGSTDFSYAEDGNSRWGWVVTVSEPGEYSTPIYAAAGQNDPNNGFHVGDLVYNYDGSNLTVNYNMYSGFSMSETHLYAGYEMPNKIAPGLFGNTHYLDFVQNDEFNIELGGFPIYIVAHAVVCY